jgi:hypothetical protein
MVANSITRSHFDNGTTWHNLAEPASTKLENATYGAIDDGRRKPPPARESYQIAVSKSFVTARA